MHFASNTNEKDISYTSCATVNAIWLNGLLDWQFFPSCDRVLISKFKWMLHHSRSRRVRVGCKIFSKNINTVDVFVCEQYIHSTRCWNHCIEYRFTWIRTIELHFMCFSCNSVLCDWHCINRATVKIYHQWNRLSCACNWWKVQVFIRLEKWTHKINDTFSMWLFEPICEQSIWFRLWLTANGAREQQKKSTIRLKIVRNSVAKKTREKKNPNEIKEIFTKGLWAEWIEHSRGLLREQINVSNFHHWLLAVVVFSTSFNDFQ